ncbi:unnamed protein product [Owenia fusiformis]|nr:unnamed protein product [Owenia fusiformis]
MNQEEEQEESQVDENEGKVPIIEPHTSIRYMESKAYAETYGDEPVWTRYRRNYSGGFPPKKPRTTCIRGGRIASGNPCPVCRDEYLVLHRENTKLLKQFLSPNSGDVLPTTKTNICQKQFRNLLIAVEQAWDYGYIEKPLPSRKFDYSEYYPSLKEQKQ